MLDLTKKIIPHIQGQRRSPSKTVGGVKLHLETNSIPARDARRAQTKPCAHQETPQRLSQTCLWVSPVEVWVSSGLLQGQGLWVQQSWVWHKPFWRRLPLTPPSELTGLGKQNLVHTKTQEKGAVTPQDTDPDLPVSVQESLGESWVNSGLPQGWGPWVWQCVHGNFERGYYLHSL